MLARSTNIAEEIAKTPTTAIVVKPVTMENRPPSEHEEHVSAWGMAEMVRFLRLPGVKVSLFNACAYQADRARGDRRWKPQQFAGTLFGIEQMNASCKCGDAKHRAIIGKKASQESGEYPRNKYGVGAIPRWVVVRGRCSHGDEDETEDGRGEAVTVARTWT